MALDYDQKLSFHSLSHAHLSHVCPWCINSTIWYQSGAGNNNNNANVYNAVIRARPWREFTRFIRWMQTKRQVAANPQTKPTDLGCESTCRLLASTPIVTIYGIIKLNTKADTYFTGPQRVEGWVDLGGWLHTKMVYRPTHPSTNRAQRTVTTLTETTVNLHHSFPQHPLNIKSITNLEYQLNTALYKLNGNVKSKDSRTHSTDWRWEKRSPDIVSMADVDICVCSIRRGYTHHRHTTINQHLSASKCRLS